MHMWTKKKKKKELPRTFQGWATTTWIENHYKQNMSRAIYSEVLSSNCYYRNEIKMKNSERNQSSPLEQKDDSHI